MPFEKLMAQVAALGTPLPEVTLDELATRWGEPVQRIMDAIDAIRVLHGETTYISLRPS